MAPAVAFTVVPAVVPEVVPTVVPKVVPKVVPTEVFLRSARGSVSKECLGWCPWKCARGNLSSKMK